MSLIKMGAEIWLRIVGKYDIMEKGYDSQFRRSLPSVLAAAVLQELSCDFAGH